jgi:SAM-dependent methyltransferase
MRKPLIIARQGRRPTGLLGAIVARVMARETDGENDHALELLQLGPKDRVLEVGYGHGDTLAKAAKAVTAGSLRGIDFSPAMHRLAMRRHRRLVQAERIEFHHGNSDRLPFADAAFDKVYAVHTIYFWRAPLEHLREIRRVLDAGGRFVLGFRPAEDERFIATNPPEIYCMRPEAEVVDLVRQAGFGRIETSRCQVGAKRIGFAVAAR